MILDDYLLPEAIKKAGLKEGLHQFKVSEEVKDLVIRDYCREPGVRSLKRLVNKITEKIAYNIVINENT